MTDDQEQQHEVVDPRATPAGWVPEFKGQRAPFRPRHTVTSRHGFYSERMLALIAKQVLDEVLVVDANAYLQEPQWRPALTAWARAEAQVLALLGYIEWLSGAVDGDGVPVADGLGDLGEDRTREAYLLQHRAEARATSGRTRVGLDPLSRARMGRDVAAAQVGVAELLARVAEARGGQL